MKRTEVTIELPAEVLDWIAAEAKRLGRSTQSLASLWLTYAVVTRLREKFEELEKN